MPAGFRRDNLWCRQLRDYKQAQHSSPIDSLDNDFITSLSDSSSQIPIQDNELDDLPVSPVLQQSSMSNIPILRCVDKPSSSLPSRLMFTEDSIRASVDFRRIDTIKKTSEDIISRYYCACSTTTRCSFEHG